MPIRLLSTGNVAETLALAACQNDCPASRVDRAAHDGYSRPEKDFRFAIRMPARRLSDAPAMRDDGFGPARPIPVLPPSFSLGVRPGGAGPERYRGGFNSLPATVAPGQR